MTGYRTSSRPTPSYAVALIRSNRDRLGRPMGRRVVSRVRSFPRYFVQPYGPIGRVQRDVSVLRHLIPEIGMPNDVNLLDKVPVSF